MRVFRLNGKSNFNERGEPELGILANFEEWTSQFSLEGSSGFEPLEALNNRPCRWQGDLSGIMSNKKRNKKNIILSHIRLKK
jgi:hypothetical protein